MRIPASSILAALLWVVPILAQNPFRAAPPEVEEALRARVTRFYTLIQEGKFRDAEQLVSEDSREAYYLARKTRIFGFDIKSIEFSPDLEKATVVMTLRTVVPLVKSGPVDLPSAGRWKLLDGQWYIFFNPPPEGEEVPTPFGTKRIPPGGDVPAGRSSPFQRPTLDSLKTMYSVSAKSLSFPAASPAPVTKTVTLSNRARGRLTLEQRGSPIPGIAVAAEPAEIGPGEVMTISLTYQPQIQPLSGNHQVDFIVQPISQTFSLDLVFESR